MQPNMDLSEVSSIVVDLSEPPDLPPYPSANTCFIAAPFSDEFKPVVDQIIIAASDLKLQPICLNHTQVDPNFLKDLQRGIRSARVVVALLSPEAATSKPNPNVLYEVGFANAIGKPVIMLTNDIQCEPADLEKQQFKKYGPTTDLLLMFKDVIRTTISGMKTPLTDPQAKNVTVSYRRHRPLLNPEFWDSLGDILSFAKRIHQNVLHIEQAASSLRKKMDDVWSKEGPRRQEFRQLNDLWEGYDADFRSNFVPNVAARLDTDSAEVEDCFQQLLTRTDVSGDTKRAIATSRDFYVAMRTTLRQFQTIHEDLAQTLISATARLDSDAVTEELLTKIRNLYSQASNCSNQARQLIFNLIGMLY